MLKITSTLNSNVFGLFSIKITEYILKFKNNIYKFSVISLPMTDPIHNKIYNYPCSTL